MKSFTPFAVNISAKLLLIMETCGLGQKKALK